jgi:site-specific recombinase XerD
MTNLKRIKTGLYRDRHTRQYYAIVKRGGKQIKRALGTDREDIVGTKLAKFLADNPNTLKVVAANLTWKNVREVWERQELSKRKAGNKDRSTQKDYLNRLAAIEAHWPVTDDNGKTVRKPLAETRVRDIGEMDCKDWLAARRKQLGKSRLRAEIFSLNWIFDKAIEMGCIARSPSKCLGSIKVPYKQPQIPSDRDFTETVRLLREAQRHNAADFEEFIAYCGCRLEEVSHIHGRDIGAKLLTIREDATGWSTKNDNDRTVEINDSLADLFVRIQKRRGVPFAPDEPLFPVHNPRYAWATASRIAKVSVKISARPLRRFFVRQCIQAGIDFQTIADWLGHGDGGVLVAQVYSFLCRDHAARMAKKFTFSAAAA